MQQISKRLLSWASIVEPGTLAQAELTATLPFIHPHVALMPDCHLGKGATVGSVIPTLGAIIPAAVGVDIGCGMMAVRTRFTETEVRDRGQLDRLHGAISAAVPLSAGRYNDGLHSEHTGRLVDELEQRAARDGVDPDRYAANWRLQLGSLGSGNHFIEVTADEEGRIWLFLHSGSRGVGNKMAQHHIAVAQQLSRRWWIDLPDRDLAYLVEGTDEFAAYLRDLRWAQHFALLNRVEMMDRVKTVVARHLLADDLGISEEVNCHHNYTEQETHGGKQVWLSRKGAISARRGQLGLIPGSMGTASYVVEGLGNKAALNSAPHGAGRAYSRSAARRTFSRSQLDEAMVGIAWGRSDAFLDEIPGAYKDVDVVMADAADLVRPLHVLHQLVNVKGD
jgi:tRNA-splicing ligase RtcB